MLNIFIFSFNVQVTTKQEFYQTKFLTLHTYCGILPKFTGVWHSWLARRSDKAEVGGSSPPTPTKSTKWVLFCLFSTQYVVWIVSIKVEFWKFLKRNGVKTGVNLWHEFCQSPPLVVVHIRFEYAYSGLSWQYLYVPSILILVLDQYLLLCVL